MMNSKNRPESASPTMESVCPPNEDLWLTLRLRVEELLREKELGKTDVQESQWIEEVRQLLHKLQVDQNDFLKQNRELRRTQVRLKSERKRYYDLYDRAPVGYCTLNEQGFLLEVNLTAATMLGILQGELVGQPINRYICKEDLDIYYYHREKLFETGEPQMCELRMVQADFTLIWVTLTATATTQEDGEPSCSIVINDISERKKAQELRARQELLLKKAQRMKSVGRLAGGVAHGFNNMLGIIFGYSELALENLSQSDPLYDKIQKIREAAERSADLTQQLLAFASKQVFSPKILDLNKNVETKLKVLGPAFGENIKFELMPEPELWSISMDPSQIDQVLNNLIENAAEAIVESGEITLKTGNITLSESYCKGHPWLRAGDYVQLTLSDSGRGIDKEMMDKLFEPFSTSKEMSTGAGLGLATVYGVVKQNNGFIDVKSELDEGATFTIYLPRYEDEQPKIQTEEFFQQEMDSQETILLVEDEPTVLELVTRLLEIKGYQVLATDDPLRAIHMAREHVGRIDLLLTDVVMPEMNGDDMAERLLTDNPSLKCIFMSGYSEDIITQRGLLVDDIHFIQKPFTIDNLMTKIQGVIRMN